MKFYQYATGRAPGGYGFSMESEGVHFNNDTFRHGRDLSRMPEGSVVYEMHYVDGQHTALVMTQVCSFGSGNICYTHSLISEQSPSTVQLVRLLKADSFLQKNEFLGLENLKREIGYLPLKELDIPEQPEAQYEIWQELIGKTNMLYSFLGYMWRLCWGRSQGEEISPAYLVMPKDWSYQEIVEFFSACVLNRLPEKLRQYASVVFNAGTEVLGEFPKTTSCFVIREAPRGVTTVFDFSTIDKRPPESVNIIYHELGKSLWEPVEWPLVNAYRNGLPRLGKNSTDSFALAFRFQHLDILAAQNNKNMERYQKYFCARYSELLSIFKHMPSEETRKQMSPLEIRTALVSTERAAFKYWLDVAAGEATPVNLYLDLITKALRTPDDGLWQDYLVALSSTVQLADGANENELLLDYGKQHLNGVDVAKNSADQTIIDRFADLLALRLKKSGEAGFAQKLLWNLSSGLLSVSALRGAIHDILCNHLSDLRQSDVTAILNASIWKDDEKSALMAKLVEGLEKSSPSGELLLTLCDLIMKYQFAGAIPALVQCAERVRMNGQDAERVANTLLYYNNKQKLRPAEKTEVLKLYAEQPNEAAMRRLLDEMFNFTVNEREYPSWAELRSKVIGEDFQRDLARVENVDQLLQVAELWMTNAEKKYHEIWVTFAENIPGSGQCVKNACAAVEKNMTVKDFYRVAQDVRTDWFGQTMTEEFAHYMKEHLDALITDRRNFQDMPLLVRLTTEYQRFNMTGDKRIQCIAVLDSANLVNTNPFALYRDVEEFNPSEVVAYLKYWAKKQESKTLEWEIVLQLMMHWGNYRDGWDAFFKQREWTPALKSSPWKGELYPMHALRHVCRLLVTAGAGTKRREELLRFIMTAPAWAGYVRHMEKKREFQAFIRDENIECPSLRRWLEL